MIQTITNKLIRTAQQNSSQQSAPMGTDCLCKIFDMLYYLVSATSKHSFTPNNSHQT